MSLWCVYERGWVAAWSSDASGENGKRECEAQAAELKLAAGSWRAVPWSTNTPGQWPWSLEVHRPWLAGEFADKGEADSIAGKIRAHGGDVTVVEQGSAEEIRLRRTASEAVSR
jgi:hypothetical protein